MAASNSKGVEVFLMMGSATPETITPTAATKAAPVEVSTGNIPTGMNEDWIVDAPDGSTSLPEVDGQFWPVTNVTGAGFDLLGSDASSSSASFSNSTDMNAYDLNTDFVKFCLSTLEFNPETPTTVSAGTYCDPSQSVASALTSAGTASLGGYIDITASDYAELLAWDNAGGSRLIVIKMPNNGTILMSGELGPVTWNIPIDGALGWTSTLVLSAKPRHLF